MTNRVSLFPLGFALFFLLIVPLVSADIMSVDISNDARKYIPLKGFCFTKSGEVWMNVSSFSTAAENSSSIGLVMIPWIEYFGAQITREKTNTCLPKEDYAFLGVQNSTNHIPMTTDGKFFIYLRNCAPPGTQVTLKGVLEIFNVDHYGNKIYLTDWEEHLPEFLWSFSAIYAIFAFTWGLTCYRNIQFVRRIHILIGALLAVKFATLFIAAEEKFHVKTTGKPHGWNIYLYAFHAIRTILFWTVIMLIGSGWSYLKPLLQLKEKIMLAIGVVIQVVLNIAYVYMDEMGQFSRNYDYMFYAFLFTDLASFGVAAVPFLWFLDSLKEAATKDGMAAKTLHRMRLVKGILMMVMLYMEFTRLIKYSFGDDDMVCSTDMLMTVVSEPLYLLLCLVIFSLLRPAEDNDYVLIEVANEETALREIRRDFG